VFFYIRFIVFLNKIIVPRARSKSVVGSGIGSPSIRKAPNSFVVAGRLASGSVFWAFLGFFIYRIFWKE